MNTLSSQNRFAPLIFSGAAFVLSAALCWMAFRVGASSTWEPIAAAIVFGLTYGAAVFLCALDPKRIIPIWTVLFGGLFIFFSLSGSVSSCLTETYCTESPLFVASFYSAFLLDLMGIVKLLPLLLIRFIVNNTNGPVILLGGVQTFFAGMMLLVYYRTGLPAETYQYAILYFVLACGVLSIAKAAAADPDSSPKSRDKKIMGLLFFLNVILFIFTIPFGES